MSVNIATMGMFRDCCGGGPGAGGGAPPIYQYEARGEEFPIHVKVRKVSIKKPTNMPTISIDIGQVRSERKI
jgi:hypothetical protein